MQNFIKRNTKGRRTFCTEDGYIGLGPHGISPGDQVYTMPGCPSLLVLRPSMEAGVEGHIAVGQCSLRTFADLEALLGPLSPSWYVQEGSQNYVGDVWYVQKEAESTVKTRWDPRLGMEIPGWSVKEDLDDAGADILSYKNNTTGNESQYDPRLTDVDFLTERGVDVKDVYLI